MWAGDLLLVLVQGEDFLEFLVAIVAEIIVHGHRQPPANFLAKGTAVGF
jgi:hypothetical protein